MLIGVREKGRLWIRSRGPFSRQSHQFHVSDVCVCGAGWDALRVGEDEREIFPTVICDRHRRRRGISDGVAELLRRGGKKATVVFFSKFF